MSTRPLALTLAAAVLSAARRAPDASAVEGA